MAILRFALAQFEAKVSAPCNAGPVGVPVVGMCAASESLIALALPGSGAMGTSAVA